MTNVIDVKSPEKRHEEKSLVNNQKEEPIINVVSDDKVGELKFDTEQNNKGTYNLIQEQKRIAEERSNRLDRYNYDLEMKKEPRYINQIEDEPAYKRQGIELESVESSKSEEPISRLTINEEDKELRNNNSFLHDNVD